MGDQSHGRLVDAHAERAGRDDHANVVVEEPLQHGAALGCRHAGVIRRGRYTRFDHDAGETVDQPARRCIHDTCATRAADQGGQPRQAILATRDADDIEAQVRPIERTDDLSCIGPEPERILDVAAHVRRRRAGEGDDGRGSDQLPNASQRAKARSEIVAPLDDAVGLVHRDSADTAAPRQQFVGESRQPLG